MKFNPDKAFILLGMFNFLFLLFFSGLYFMIKVTYVNLPEEHYFFVGAVPTKGQLLFSGFGSLDIIITSLVISIVVAIIHHVVIVIKILPRNTMVRHLMLTVLMSLVYTMYKLLTLLNVDNRVIEVYLNEIYEEVTFLAFLYVIISIPLSIFIHKTTNKIT